MVLPPHLRFDQQRLGDAGDWDSPYSWPVRREFSRILHRPRPHVGIVYTERFLNSRPLTYFDDETKIIRARAGAILKAVHTPVPKPSRILRPYETLDSYRNHALIPYGVPQHIYRQSYYSDPAYLTIGRGHLACMQYAGGKGYPRRKNLYSDENRNIRDEIKFRSYYNRPKHDDPNTLPTGFAWRLLHLPPKEEKTFKLYKHSRTLPSLMSKDKENTSLDEDKDNVPAKRIHKTYTQPLDEPSKTKASKVYSSPKESYTLKENISARSKIEPREVIDDSPKKEIVEEKPEPIVEEKQAPTPVQPVAAEEESTGIKKKKSKKEETDKPYNRSLSKSKSVSEDKLPEKVETKNDIPEPVDKPVIEEEVPEPPVEETKLESTQEILEEPIVECPVVKEEPEQTIAEETPIVDETPIAEEIEVIEEKEVKKVEDVAAPAPEPEEINPSEPDPEPEEPPQPSEPTEESVQIVEQIDTAEPPQNESTPIVEEISQINEPDVNQGESNEIAADASRTNEELEVVDESVKSVSEDTETKENKQEEAEGVVICNGTESYTETRFGEDDEGELVITEVREETSDTTVEASSGQLTTTVYSTTTETVIEAVDTITTEISQVPEHSDLPEEHINETDITTDEENVEILSE